MPYKVLVADDDAALVMLIQEALERQGYIVLTASNSGQVRELVISALPDMLVVGHRLPGTDGFALMEELRATPHTQGLPLIMLTTHMEEADVHRAWQLGVDSLQSKREEALPRLTLELVVKVKHIFKSPDEDRSGRFNSP
jgi:CheY-like chemotaxis protein